MTIVARPFGQAFDTLSAWRAHTQTHTHSLANAEKEEQREILLNFWAGFIWATMANVGNFAAARLYHSCSEWNRSWRYIC